LIQKVELVVHFSWLKVGDGQQLIIKIKQSAEKEEEF